MSTLQQTSKQYFKSLHILFWAMVIAQLMVALVAVFVVQESDMDERAGALKNLFLVVVPLLVAASVTGAVLVFRKLVNNLKLKPGLIGKMTGYRTALMVRFALLEGATLIAIAVFLVTGYWLVLAMAGLMIVFFFTYRPSPERAALDLELNTNERIKIEDQDAVIAEYQSR